MSTESQVEEGQTEEATASTEPVDETAAYVVEGDGEEATASDNPDDKNSGTTEDESNESESGESEEEESDEQSAGAEENTSSQTPKHKTGDERFKDLTRERYEADARANVAEQRYQQTLAELEALKAQKPGNAGDADDGKPKVLARPSMPTRESVEYDDDAYANAMDQYQDDLEAYHNQQFDLRYQKREEDRLNQVAEAQQVELAEQTEEAFQKRQDAFIAATGADGKAKYPDYEKVVFTDNVKITTIVASAIKEAENGPEMLYAIAKSQNLMNKLLTVSPTQALIELGKLSVKTKSAGSKKKVTKAPDPIEPIDGSGGSNLYQNMEDMPIGDFMAAEERKFYGDA